MKAVNVLIADDHILTARLLANMLSAVKDLNITGLASNGHEVLKILSKKPVDVLVLDIIMPELDGLSIMNQIIKKHPLTKILILSSHTEAWVIQKSLKSGASGYLTKFVDSKEVVDAILTVHKGGNYFCKTTLNAIMKDLTIKSKETGDISNNKHLTKRECEILKMIAKEYTTAEIAEKISVSVRTVETHRKNLLHKLGVKNTVGLIMAAIQSNLIENVNQNEFQEI